MGHKLAILSTHPIQYYVPSFQKLDDSENIHPRVFYSWTGSTEIAHDHGFDRVVEWDIPLLEGYDFEFVPNDSSDPGTHHFRGLVNPSLIPSIENWDPDAVLVFGWAWQSHLQALVHFHGRVPVVFRGDSTLIDEQPGVRKMLRRGWLWWVYRHVDQAQYVGSHNRRYFEAHGLSDEQLHWVPHAVDNSRFTDPDGTYQKQATDWRRELGIPASASVVLFAGKLERKKAPDVLFQAFSALEQEGVHLAVVGDGPVAPKLREQASGHSRIHFLGFQNQSRMPVVYRLGDVFVLPSRGPGETWGLAVNEAMASKRPVIVSDRVGCAPDLVENGHNGHVVPSEDVEALCDALAEIVRNPECQAAMSQCSAHRIADWSIDEAARRTEAGVHGLAG